MMANGRGDDFTPLVRLMRTVNSIHYPTRFAQVFFSKKAKKFLRTHTAGFSVGRGDPTPPRRPEVRLPYIINIHNYITANIPKKQVANAGKIPYT